MASASPTVLLVDDQTGLLELLAVDLEHRGYTVLTAKDAVEALEKCQHHVGPIHLLIADIFLSRTVPARRAGSRSTSWNGIELWRYLKTLRPDIKVLFISGYEKKDIDSLGGLPPDAPFLPKPFSPEPFLKKVHTLVSGVGSP